MQFNHLQSNNTHNASFAPNTAADANQQPEAQPQARPIPPLENAADLSNNPAARNLQTYNTSCTPQGPTDSLAPDTWNAPEYQPIQPGAPYMEKLADEAMNTKAMERFLKHAQEDEAEGDFKNAEKNYKKALKYTENPEHYKLYAECLQKISASLKDATKASVYKEKAVRAFYYLGNLYQKQGALQDAQAAYKASCDLALYEALLQALVDVTRQLGDATELAAALENLGDFYAGKGVIASAIDKLKEAFEVGKSVKILEKLEVLYRQEGGEDALEKLADFYAEKGAITLAIAKLKEAFEARKSDRILEKLEVLYRQEGGEDALEKLADFYAEKGAITLAIAKLKEAFEARKSAKILEKLEDLYRQEGEENNQPQMHEIAIQRFELQLRQDPKNIGLYTDYAWFLKDIGRKSEARAVKKRIYGLLQQKVVKQKTKIGGLKQTIHLQAEKIHLQAGELQTVGKQLEFLNRQAIHLDFSHCPAMQDADFIPLLMHNHNPYAQSLNLAGCEHLTDAVLHILPERYENLQELNLTSCKGVTEGGLSTIIENATQLKRLILDYCPATTIKLLHKLNAKGIAFSIEGVVFETKKLDLSHRKETLTDADLLQKLQENPEITTLNLSGCTKITDAGLAPLKNFQWLTSLDLTSCSQFTDLALQHLSGLTQLTFLSLNSCNKFINVGLRHLSGLSRLTFIDFRSSQLTDEGLRHLAGISQLETLWLSGTQVTGAGLSQLSGVKKFDRLSFYGCPNITDEGLSQFLKLPQFTQLTFLNLESCSKVTDAGLSQILDLKRLKALYLSGPQISDVSLGIVSQVQELTSLSLAGCTEIADIGLEHLTTLTHLNSLILRRCPKFTNRGLKSIGKLTRLTELDLGPCQQLENEGLQHIGNLTGLTYLTLAGCQQITDEGLQHLRGLTQLKTLNLQGCKKITDGAKAQLKKQIRGLTIIG